MCKTSHSTEKCKEVHALPSVLGDSSSLASLCRSSPGVCRSKAHLRPCASSPSSMHADQPHPSSTAANSTTYYIIIIIPFAPRAVSVLRRPCTHPSLLLCTFKADLPRANGIALRLATLQDREIACLDCTR